MQDLKTSNSQFKSARNLGCDCRPNTMASSVDAKMLKSTKFPLEFNQKVDMTKVNVEVMKKYDFPVEWPHGLNLVLTYDLDGSQGRYPRF